MLAAGRSRLSRMRLRALSVFILFLVPWYGAALLTNCTDIDLTVSATYTINSDLSCDQITVEVGVDANVIIDVGAPVSYSGVRFVVAYGGSLTFTGSSVILANSSVPGVPAAADNIGGALLNYGRVDIRNSLTFSTNTGVLGADAQFTYGSALYNAEGAVLTAEGPLSFVGNTLAQNGAGFFNAGNATLTDTTWISNSAQSFGGGLDNIEPGIVTFLGNSLFQGNSGIGGGFSSNGTIVFAANTTTQFISNTGTTTGGAVCGVGGTTTFFGSAEFVGNSASLGASAIFTKSPAVVTFTVPTNFTDNGLNDRNDPYTYVIRGDGTVNLCGMIGSDAVNVSQTLHYPLECGGDVSSVVTASDTSSSTKTRNIIIGVFIGFAFIVITALTWLYYKRKVDKPAIWKWLSFKAKPSEGLMTTDPSSVSVCAVLTGGESKSPSDGGGAFSSVGSAPPHGLNTFSHHTSNREGAAPPEVLPSPTTQANMRVVTYDFLQKASNMFGHKLGEGGFGAVFKGSMMLESGRTIHVAIKHLNSDSQQGFKELWTEVTMLWRLRQSNLVPVLAVCPDPCCIVYPLMENGSLLGHLEDPVKRGALQWRDRVSIMLDVAAGLVFLHDKKVVHRDIKPANILLSVNMAARLSDFGIARILTSTSFARTDPIGSYLYMDPNYLSSGILSRHSDMYSYGVVGLQILTGKEERAIPGLRNTVQTAAANSDLGSVIDSACTEWPESILPGFTDLMLACTEGDPLARRSAPQAEELVRSWLDTAPSAPAPMITWECLVCLEQQRSELFQPCLHVVCCSTCADLLYTSVLPQCPLCRSHITAVLPHSLGSGTYALA